MPQGRFEEYGIEDPRITQIGNNFYITYVSVSRHGCSTSMMMTRDFYTFHRLGVVFCPENKDVLLFPEKIGGRYIAMHRPVTSIRFRPPEIWIARGTDLLHFGEHDYLHGGHETPWHADRVGGGTPPLATDRGRLTLFHGSDKPKAAKGPGIYTAGAMLLDLNDPARVVATTREPIMKPELDFETTGFVNNIIFPTAVIPLDDMLHIYYGAADERVGVTAFRTDELLGALENLS